MEGREYFNCKKASHTLEGELILYAKIRTQAFAEAIGQDLVAFR